MCKRKWCKSKLLVFLFMFLLCLECVKCFVTKWWNCSHSIKHASLICWLISWIIRSDSMYTPDFSSWSRSFRSRAAWPVTSRTEFNFFCWNLSPEKTPKESTPSVTSFRSNYQLTLTFASGRLVLQRIVAQVVFHCLRDTSDNLKFEKLTCSASCSVLAIFSSL